MTPKQRLSTRTSFMPVVLVVDPDRSTTKGIGLVLERAGLLPLYAATASEALKAARKTAPRAVILSAVLPDMKGARLVKLLRTLPSLKRTPILVLSVPSSDGLEIECLKNGADDFLVWGVNDLSAIPLRLSRALQTARIDGAEIERGLIRVDLESREVSIGGRRMQAFRPRELDLLVYLMRKSPGVATWTDIQRDVWSIPEHALDHGRETKTIAVHCDRLRQKLGVAGRYIAVRRGVGLQFKCGK